MARKLLITGGAGFIGVNTARRFLKDGWDVTIFDNFSRKGTDLNVDRLKKEYPTISVKKGDIRDQNALTQIMDTVDAVVHLAAQVAVTTSVVDPRDDFENNALGTFNVLEAIRLSKKKPILLYSCTNKVYGALEDLKVVENKTNYTFADATYKKFGVSENRHIDFHSPYGCSKGAADQYVLDYSRIYGLRTVSFRQSCIYGPHQFGIEDQGWVAWLMIAAMLGRPITVFGTGKQVRDLLYIDDLTDLYVRAIENIEVTSGQAYNIGGGPSNTLSLKELFAYLEKEKGYNISPKQADVRPGDQPIFVADIRKAKKNLGWTPQTNVPAGLEKLHSWLLENKTQLQAFFATPALPVADRKKIKSR